jgi:hypothetical protein
MVLHHQPPPGAAEAERGAAKTSALVEHGADHAGGIQLPELLLKIKALREAGLRAEHVAFSFMKRRVQPLMVCDTLGYQYTGDDDTSRMPGTKVDDDDIVERLGGSSRICHNTHPAQSRSTQWLVRQTRLVAELMSVSTHCIVEVELTQYV